MKYKLRLSVASSYYITQVCQLVKNLMKSMSTRIEGFVPTANRNSESDFCEITLSHLMSEIKCLDYDLGKLKSFIEDTDLTHKVMYFSFNQVEKSRTERENPRPMSSSLEGERNKEISKGKDMGQGTNKGRFSENPEKKQEKPLKTTPTTFTNVEKIFSFIISLIKGYRFDSTVILTFNHSRKEDSSLSFYPLDISPLFNEIVNKSHCVLFTGGTMKPKGLLEEVLKHCAKEVVSKDFPPVIAAENIFCGVMSGCPPTHDFLFNQANSSKLEPNFRALCDLILNIEKEIPGGIVVFFTSYNYLNTFKNLCVGNLRLSLEREIIFDSDKAWDQYKDAIINQKKSAILFSVMGGKLSEGINFKDELGNRCLHQPGASCWSACLTRTSTRPTSRFA